MSTVKKGDTFEKRVFATLKEMIASGALPIPKDSYKMYMKKKYFSKDRNDNIIVDISIEVFLPGGSEPWFYFIVECKDYSKSIPVDDIEEFCSKVGQITGLNVKALFVTTRNLQKGAFNFAVAKKIGVVRLFPDDKFNWLITRASKEITTTNANIITIRVFNALADEEFENIGNYDALGIIDGKCYTDFREMVQAIFQCN